MLRRLTAILLLLALINCSCSRFAVCAGFGLNRAYITRELCINKTRPWLHCNGKCYLMKKIKQAEENEKKQSERDNLNRLEISLFQEIVVLTFQQPESERLNQTSFPGYSYLYSSRYIDTLFRPPKMLA
ncbi:hypothetical protein G7092_02395 [Mucilaginibacter sp. HC2]|nr:hypothetical protein [Mucilaginibacter inviolabilis]